METIRVALKTPFLKHPAGTVFELPKETIPMGWEDDERLREKINFSNKRAYFLPDGGRGYAAELPVNDTKICPEHVFEGTDLRTGLPRVTKAETGHATELPTQSERPPCGLLKEDQVSLEQQPDLKRWGIVINLPPFETVAEKMVLTDTMRNEKVLEYELRNYKLTDTRLDWDVSDLNPGFYELRVYFPDEWFHSIRFIKFFPILIDAENIPPAPEKPWQTLAKQILENMGSGLASEDELRNQALDFCLEWGEMFQKPTQERMMQKYPQLAQEEADRLDRLAREVRSFVYALCEDELAGKILESDIHFATKRKYPWVNAANFNRMKNVGMYYARR